MSVAPASLHLSTPGTTDAASTPSWITDAVVTRLRSGVRTSPGAERETVVAPFTGLPAFEVDLSSLDDVEAAFAAARRAQVAWAARPVAERAAIFRRTFDALLDAQSDIVDLLQLESGKARFDAFAEVAGAATAAGYYGRIAPEVLSPHQRRGLFPVLTMAIEAHQPKGVIGISAAWNFPVVFASYDGFPALIAGNAVVYRPDTQAALSVLRVRELAIEAGLPPEVWQVVLGPGRTIGAAVMDRGDYVAFTGSTRVGRIIAESAGRRLTGASLELGGKNALIVCADADVAKAASGAVRATFTNAGQACVGTERILVHDSIADAFTQRFVAEVARMRVGAGYTYDFDMGTLVNQAQLDRVAEHVEDAVTKGATVLTGGHRLPDIGPLVYAPTVLTGVRPGMLCRDDETFGPVVSLERFSTEDEAVVSANATSYGLAASVWTGDAKRGVALAQRLRAGTVDVNEGYFASWGSIELPQGGMRDSGLGRRNGPGGLLRFTEPQGITVQRLHGIHPPAGMSKETFASVMGSTLRVLKKLGLR